MPDLHCACCSPQQDRTATGSRAVRRSGRFLETVGRSMRRAIWPDSGSVAAPPNPRSETRLAPSCGSPSQWLLGIMRSTRDKWKKPVGLVWPACAPPNARGSCAQDVRRSEVGAQTAQLANRLLDESCPCALLGLGEGERAAGGMKSRRARPRACMAC